MPISSTPPTKPQSHDELLLLGMTLLKKEDVSGAVDAFERIVESEPDSFDGSLWLSMALRRQSAFAEALASAGRAVEIDGKNEHALNQLGLCQMDLGLMEQAVLSFKRAVEIAPSMAPIFENLGRALQAFGRNSEAIAAFRQVLAIGPVRPGSLFRLGDAYMMEPDPSGAAQCAHAILRMEPDSVSGNLLLARALIADGLVEDGAKFAKRAMELSPGNAVPVAYYGRALQSLGQIDEADKQFRRSIELEPRQGFAYHALVHNHRVLEEERPTVESMAGLAREGRLPKRELIQLEYGLGKALEDLGDCEAAMGHFDTANRIDHELKIGVVPFQSERLRETADFLIDTFDYGFIERHQVLASDSETPIFIVGMMRSGTTLAEQILSSHRDIGGAGELLFWPENAGSSEKVFSSTLPGRSTLNAVRLQQLIAAYVELLRKMAPGKARVVDKMNTNYLLLGILNIAFPNAKIVHMRRHPVDTCLSIWATPVANGIDLCGDKRNVVFAYRQYLRIMEHWRSVLPADRLLDVQYEQLVSDRESVTRRMVEFCELPWDEACMRPEGNSRSVKTPSVWQVRQPVYKTSIERWRKYEPWLGPFAELFDVVNEPTL